MWSRSYIALIYIYIYGEEENIAMYRPIAREPVGKHVSVEIDSWKPTRRCVINRHFLGYEIERRFLCWSILTLYNKRSE
jgi:hypothetical protein